ncbi:MAG: hypothetical protein H6738_09025 [Alphaproteobacteria bacterium]|nr:hypothetical protein [Alphaproteobacteria bacterium]MCB9696904.1 hypothetical protein [Alphaproteobacteria bacterium]
MIVTLGTLAFAADHVHVRDLDPTELPETLSWDARRERLVVDGRVVRGSRTAQLDWLVDVLDDGGGDVADALRVDERTRALRHRRTGTGLVVAGMVLAGGAVLTPFGWPALGVAGAGLCLEGGGLATLLPARRDLADDALGDEVALLFALRSDALAASEADR